MLLRIVYLTHQYLPRHIGGTEVYTHGLAVRARRAGHSVHVITYVESVSPDAIHYQAFRTEHEGIPVIELHYNLSQAPNPARAEYDNPYTAALVRQELEAIKPDLVHALHLMKLSAAALDVCYSLEIPVVLTLTDYWLICPGHTLVRWNQELCDGPVHDLDCVRCLHAIHGFAGGRNQNLPAPLVRLISRVGSRLFHAHLSPFWVDIQAIRERANYLRKVAQRADRVIALSDFQKEKFVLNGYSPQKIQVLHHGLDTEGLKPARLGRLENVEIVFIGSLVYHKGPHILLQALAQCPELKVRLRLYGEAGDAKDYLDLLNSLAASDHRVRMMGTFPHAEMGSVLESAHVLAMPALWYENEPLVIKAAQYVGLPVLASNIGTLANTIRHGENGWLVPPGDVAAWSSALEKLDPRTLSLNVPDHSVKSMDENARELLAIYQETLLNKQCPKPII
jgi:glycosyltransferase involved in cell wall biosynthesis